MAMKSIHWHRRGNVFARNIHPRLFFPGRSAPARGVANNICGIARPALAPIRNPRGLAPHYRAAVTARGRHGTYARTSSGSSYSADDCPYRAFAKAHPEAASQVLAVPSFSQHRDLCPSSNSSLHPFMNNATEKGGETLENYLKLRGWDIERILQEHNLGDDMVPSAVGLFSHPLTFPLTLGRHVKALSPTSFQAFVGENDKERINLRLCCVGARAECTLPDDFWREFLIAVLSHNGHRNENDKSFHCTIDFVGPDVDKRLTSKKISLPEVDGGYLTMNYHASFLHDVVLKFLKASPESSSSERTEPIRQFWDGFVLFNPGLGHPNLAKQWEPTIKFLVRTGKRILFTAHSMVDAERDGAVIENLIMGRDGWNGGPVQYNHNPYASRMGFVDPFASPLGADGTNQVVRPNQYTLLLQ